MYRFAVAFVLICLCSTSAYPEENGDRVVNGQSTSIFDNAHIVSIQKNQVHFCGGSIIHKKFILTAAHCLEGTYPSEVEDMQVRMGSSQWSSGGTVKRIKAWHMHPNWDNMTKENDVCLLEVYSPIIYSASIKSIPLATVTPSDGTNVKVCGWGATFHGAKTYPNILRETQLSFLTRKGCASGRFKYTKLDILDSMVCAVGPQTDACQGDSGGPLTDSKSVLVGVVSWGFGCAEKGFPGVYADVPLFVSWINKVIKTLSN